MSLTNHRTAPITATAPADVDGDHTTAGGAVMTGRTPRSGGQLALFPAAAAAGAPLTQPVPDPGNATDYHQLLHAGVLIDLAGRPLTAVTCPTCPTEATHLITSGITCPWSLQCPTCRRPPGARCTYERPSEHTLSEAFSGRTHRARRRAAQTTDDRRATAGDSTVPALWPAKPKPNRQRHIPAHAAGRSSDAQRRTPPGPAVALVGAPQ